MRKNVKKEQRDYNIFNIYNKKEIKMRIEINEKIKGIINDMPWNKTVKVAALKIYAALYLQSSRKNKFGYFGVPSEYLASINKRYSRIMKHFESAGLIKAYTRPVIDDADIFNVKHKKYYDVNRGVCMKYKFLVPTEGEQIDVDMLSNRTFRWYELIQRSLLDFGFENIKIKRDNFGRRVHHCAIMNYKEDFKGYWTIDAKCSQPHLLYLDMKKKGIEDPLYNDIFENDKDFYLEIQWRLGIKERQDAKELFMFWINGNGYVPDFKIHMIFPVASAYIKGHKIGDYKNMASHLQRIESKIWIDGIMNDIPIEWAIPIHDSIVVKEEDLDTAFNWIKAKYTNMKIKKERLK